MEEEKEEKEKEKEKKEKEEKEKEKKDLHKIANDVGLVPKIPTTLGIGERVEGALCYLLGFVTGIIFLIIEKDNKFIRFHALQSIAIFLPLYIVVSEIRDIISITMVFQMNIFGMLIYMVILSVMWTLIAILWLLLMYKASKGERYKLPIIGRIAEKYA